MLVAAGLLAVGALLALLTVSDAGVRPRRDRQSSSPGTGRAAFGPGRARP